MGKMFGFLRIIFACASGCCTAAAGEKLIFDTDIGGDPDDVLALEGITL
jgi:hypothetical protein